MSISGMDRWKASMLHVAKCQGCRRWVIFTSFCLVEGSNQWPVQPPVPAELTCFPSSRILLRVLSQGSQSSSGHGPAGQQHHRWFQRAGTPEEERVFQLHNPIIGSQTFLSPGPPALSNCLNYHPLSPSTTQSSL